MALRLLLDTNVYSALKRGHRGVIELVQRAERVEFSMVVVGELLAGFRSGDRFQRNLLELEQFLASPYAHVLPVTRLTADRYGRIASKLRLNGTPIPTNDIWIAAHVLESGAELVSFDAHFDHIEDLPIIRPLEKEV